SGSQREENIRVFARDFKDAAHRLRDHPDEGRRSAADVGDILDRASAIDRFMQRQQLDERSEGDWTLLSADLSELARVYGVRWGNSRGTGHPGDEDIAALMGRLRDRTDEFRRNLVGE